MGISLGTKFQFKLTILIFLDQSWPKSVFPVKNGETEYHHRYFDIELVLVPNFSLNWWLSLFGKSLQETVISIQTKKREERHSILHISSSLGTKFQLKLIIVALWSKFSQKEYFRSKTEPSLHFAYSK